MPFSNGDKLNCALREVNWRRHVYPRRVANKTMSEAQARNEIALMEAIVGDYRRLVVETEELPLKGGSDGRNSV